MKRLLIVLIVSALVSCKKEKPVDQKSVPIETLIEIEAVNNDGSVESLGRVAVKN